MSNDFVEARIMARRPGGEWCVRNRLGDLNFMAREQGWSREMTEMAILRKIAGWVAVEPATEFATCWGHPSEWVQPDLARVL